MLRSAYPLTAISRHGGPPVRLFRTHNARHLVTAVDQRPIRSVEASGELEALLRRRQPVLALVVVLGLVVLDVDDELAVRGVQLAALEHVAVERVAIDWVVVEIALAVVERDFPELGDRRHVVQVEGDRVAMLTRERAALRVLDAKRAGM